jgi:hypothetical protein
MPIREIKQVFGVNYQWTPVYGKALWFLSAVGYIDFFSTVGLGVAMSDFYPRKETTLCQSSDHTTNDDGVPTSTSNQCDIKTEGTSERDGTGEAARPQPEAQSSPTLSLGIGSRFYLGRIEGRNGGLAFLGNLELRNFSVFGSDPNNDAAFMNFFALWGGAGILF